MPETRIVSRTYGLGGYNPTKPNNNLVEQLTAIIPDEQLVNEAEERALAKADELISAISNLVDAKAFLRRLCARLIKKGLLP